MFEKLKEAFRKFEVSITTKTLTEQDISEPIQQLEVNLLESEVAYEAVQYIISSISSKLVGQKISRTEDKNKFILNLLRETLLNIFSHPTQLDIFQEIQKKVENKIPYSIMFLGINGTGKTTTIAKMSRLLAKKGYSVILAASDTYRAGAIEQLETHSQNLGLKILKQKYGSDPAAVARDAKNYATLHNYHVVLIDTAGRIQTSKNLMEELAKIKRVSAPDLTIFVGDSLAGNDLVLQAREFLKTVGFDAIILTKMDADAKGGASISVVYATGKPIIYIGTGQGYDDIQNFDAEWLINKLLS
ncbi:MAG: signal recognition particle-docking protein FtsY [Nitrososphaerota archaeon]